MVWLGSTAGNVITWTDTQIVAAVAATAVTGIARVQQNGSWSNATGFTVPASGGNTLAPQLLNLVVGDTHTIQALNAAAQPVTGLTWTSSDPTVVSLSTVHTDGKIFPDQQFCRKPGDGRNVHLLERTCGTANVGRKLSGTVRLSRDYQSLTPNQGQSLVSPAPYPTPAQPIGRPNNLYHEIDLFSAELDLHFLLNQYIPVTSVNPNTALTVKDALHIVNALDEPQYSWDVTKGANGAIFAVPQ